jgi:hypothetical protein
MVGEVPNISVKIDHSKKPRSRWEENIKTDLREIGWEWNGFIWLRIGTDGGLL